MNTKHTPGPWFSDEKGYIFRRHPSELYENGGSVAGDKSLAAAHRGWTQNGYPAQANARLIAAAPTLLQLVIDVYTDAHSGHELNFLTQQLLEKTLHEIDPELLQEAETLKKANRDEYERIRFMDDDEESELAEKIKIYQPSRQ